MTKKSANPPFVSIVIANYNGENYLNTCLTSVLNSYDVFSEILIIDDGSTDRSIEIIQEFKKKDKRIFLLKNKKNMGAAASRNSALDKARGDIIVFLDNDTEVKEDSIKQLIKPLIDEKEVGAAQALLIDFENKKLVQMAGGHLIPQAIWLMGFYERRKYKEIRSELRETNIIAISAALAVKKEVIDKVGHFDSKEAVYTEDLDFCWRIWIAGYTVVLARQSIVYHYTKSITMRANMGANTFNIYFQLAKNSFRSIIKNYEFINVIRFLPISLFVNLTRAVLVLLRRGDFSALIATFYSIWWNCKNLPDTLRNRTEIQRTRKFNDKRILKEVFVSGGLLDIYNRNYRSSKLLW
ncbi:MAG: glycosyltransferase family 2 protein [Actinobacteria bacterium]|nr:glycosyltransferase family 2 protein [Actinomycetota bacterium]